MSTLARHYSRFKVGERVLLTGHSHQAWPDAGFEAQQRAWLDAAEYVDDKWAHAERQAAGVREGFARLLGDDAPNIALGQNTHELVTRWLSALPFRSRQRLVTTDGEFHTLRRQLSRVAEEGVEVVAVPARPAETLGERVAATVDARTLAVLVSSVLFETSEIAGGLPVLAARCRLHGAALLVDAYHHLNAVPFDVRELDLSDAFVTGGGYKYCQLGEGNCFLRVPTATRMRPLLTGWFAEFADIESGARPSAGRRVAYSARASAFAGATYDPTSHYRAAAVFDFHQRMGLTPSRLRDISVHQVSALEAAIAALDLDPARASIVHVPARRRGGFLAVRAADADAVVRHLRDRAVFVDTRGDIIRLGPAPYVSDAQLRDAALAFGESVRAVR